MSRKWRRKANQSIRRQNSAIVDLGQIFLSDSASEYLDRYRVKVEDLLIRFRDGDWGEVGKFAEIKQNLTEEERTGGFWETSDDGKLSALSVLKHRSIIVAPTPGLVLGIYSFDPIDATADPVWVYCKIGRHTYVIMRNQYASGPYRVTEIFL